MMSFGRLDDREARAKHSVTRSWPRGCEGADATYDRKQLENYLFCGGLPWRSDGELVWSLACIQLGMRNDELSRWLTSQTPPSAITPAKNTWGSVWTSTPSSPANAERTAAPASKSSRPAL